ncbi:Peptidase family M23 [Flavobacterium noncentrifugens]|uniref:Peptidase family M23 n=2 Tax=Flavobacterium noncentrifugens TaxID=1128970 RepID=A0A1G8WMH4_9FLAO|nr:Peptidase family M23 [Flavobacterium noncentrifugens]
MDALNNLFRSFPAVKVIDSGIADQKYVHLDLAKNTGFQNFKNASEFESAIEKYLSENDADVAFGGYNEVRNLYSRSALFKNQNDEERNIHIAMDLWIKAETPVLAALDGKIHSFKNNIGLGNYGPTVILEHHFEGFTFYTLYGHLSIESLENLEIDAVFHQGDAIGYLGDATENGDYAPHLHFQMIKNLDGNFGDYPGVCGKSKLEYYLENCPDPNLLLKINNTTP